MSETSPFPIYPVTRLQEAPGQVASSTIVTEAISRSRDLVDEYLRELALRRSDPTYLLKPLILPVKGDYGTGKTHLLLDAVARFEAGLPTGTPLSVLRAPCVEANPLRWYRSVIGLEVNRLPLRVVFTELYARAGSQVASQTMLTQSASEKLANDPKAIYELVRKDRLSITDVEIEFSRTLQSLDANVCPPVWQVMAQVIREEKQSYVDRWLAGEELSPDELKPLGVTENLSKESDAGDLLVALAAAHKSVNRPLAILIDELEHLVRYDKARGSKNNILWLKRLLERLAEHETLIFVSGHWDAWDVHNDLLDRFSPVRPIELLKLNAQDVQKIVEARVPGVLDRPFDLEEAEAVVRFSDGNIRRILSILGELFRRSDSFRRVLSLEEIHKTAEEIGQRLSIEDATARIRSFLESHGIRVEGSALVAGDTPVGNSSAETQAVFDLVGYQGGDPRVVVELKHGLYQKDVVDKAQRFIKKIQTVATRFPDLLSCLIIDGNIDDELLKILDQYPTLNILAYDLTARDAMARITEGLESGLRSSSSIKETGPMAVKGDAQESTGPIKTDDPRVQELEKRIKELEQKRVSDRRQQIVRQEQFNHSSPERDETLLQDPAIEDTRFLLTYNELIKPPSTSQKLRVVLRNKYLWVSLSLAVIFLTVRLVIDRSPSVIFPTEEAWVLSIIISTGGTLLLFFVSIVLFIRQYLAVDDYYQFHNRLLRELYIRDFPLEALVSADNEMLALLEYMGPSRGKWEARQYIDRMVSQP